MLVFSVYGAAQPKGSMKAIHIPGMKFPIVTESNRNAKSWSQLVAHGASSALAQLPPAERGLLHDGVRLTVAFYLPRPKSLPKGARAHLKKPDLDKLVRGVKDALTRVLWVDDSQVVELVATKQYPAMDEPPHVDIRVEATAGTRLVVVPPAPLPLLEATL